MKANTVLAENAYNYILDEILKGRIQPGERIREDEIADEMGTSRTPVREAVNQLSQNGFIKYIKRNIINKKAELEINFSGSALFFY